MIPGRGRIAGRGRAFATWPLHPFLLAATFVINAAGTTAVDARMIGRPFAIAIVLTGLLILLALLILRDVRKAGIATTAILALNGAVSLFAIAGAVIERSSWWQSTLWTLLLVLTAALSGRLALKSLRRTDLRSIQRGLNLIAAILLLVVVGSLVLQGSATQAWKDLTSGTSPHTPRASHKPDILLLLLDGYPRADTMQRVLGEGNESFVSALRAQGFEVARRSRANYTFTQLTMASMLHMTHLVDLEAYRAISNRTAPEDPTVRNLINENPVFDRWRAEGYEIVSITPGIERVSVLSAEDVSDSGTISEFEYHLLRSTAMGALWSIADPAFLARNHHARVLHNLEEVEDLFQADTKIGGRFIWAHVLSPHMPAVFERDGSLRPVPFSSAFFADGGGDLVTPWEHRAALRNQIAYLNDRIEAVLESVIRRDPETVITLMSDHGSAVNFDWRRLDSDLDERFANLFAWRTPGRADVFTDTQTTINVFPRLFNSYLGEEMPLLPDSTWAGVVNFIEVPNPDAGS